MSMAGTFSRNAARAPESDIIRTSSKNNADRSSDIPSLLPRKLKPTHGNPPTTISAFGTRAPRNAATSVSIRARGRWLDAIRARKSSREAGSISQYSTGRAIPASARVSAPVPLKRSIDVSIALNARSLACAPHVITQNRPGRRRVRDRHRTAVVHPLISTNPQTGPEGLRTSKHGTARGAVRESRYSIIEPSFGMQCTEILL